MVESDKNRKTIEKALADSKKILEKQYVITITAKAQKMLRSTTKEEAQGFVQGFLKARNPDYQTVQVDVREVKTEAVPT